MTMETQEDGRSGADAPSGCQPTASAAVSAASSQSGIPNAAQIMALVGNRYSPNLGLWLRKHCKRAFGFPSIYRDKDGIRWIGWIDDDWFIGCRLVRCLTAGAKAEVYAYPSLAKEIAGDQGFWSRYAAIGRCAIDERHSTWFVGSDTRWRMDGDVRSCVWCGNHVQRLRRWTETVQREQWEPASGIEARSDETALAGSAEGESPVPEADARKDTP